MKSEEIFRDKVLEAKKSLSKLREITFNIARKYNMTEVEFENYISKSHHFSKTDWEKLTFFRENIKKSINVGVNSEDIKNMISYVICLQRQAKAKPFVRKNWDRV